MENRNCRALDNEELEQVTGGNDAQFAELSDYIRLHDPQGYSEIMSAPSAWQRTMILRYLYAHGIQTISATDFAGENKYTLGSYDPNRDPKYEVSETIGHQQLMNMVRSKLG
ncbi:MAG: hypothetical protein IJI66_11590 [Erysipelotrichaceae bacterium]|nr:hypothetical protein [Erysipelotrichaceae bacterium]